MSHTVTVNIQFKDPDAFAAAACALGGKDLGAGLHTMFDEQQFAGRAVTLPGWTFPLVLATDGRLHYDDYHGQWGNPADIDRLKAAYALSAARAACESLGWMAEPQADGSLLVYHPDGGTITITTDGVIDANGFQGVGCGEATEKIAAALGQTVNAERKPEYNQTTQNLTQL